MNPVRLIAPAESEMNRAARYYEGQVSGLGFAFLDKLESAFRDIAEAPDRWPVVCRNIRRRVVHRFPYGILYRVDPEEIVILAVAHLSRKPDYWLTRL